MQATALGQATHKDRRLYVGNLPAGAGLTEKQLMEARAFPQILFPRNSRPAQKSLPAQFSAAQFCAILS